MAVSPVRAVAARRPFASSLFASSLVERLLVSAWVDVVLISMVVGLAGTVRWPHLLLSPQFPSVGDTILMALDMAEGRAFYLADSAPYLGAPFIWLLALVYRVFGASLEVTQKLVWALGALTIIPTYLLGREVGGRGAGVVAALFLATSGAHTVITSHVALSHSLTPLVATTALWLVARATNRAASPTGEDAASSSVSARGWLGSGRLAQGGRLLALAGLVSGLALQTHPTAAPMLVGAALGALLMRRGWLRTRWPVVAVALVVVGYSSLLVYHVTSRFEIIGDVESKQARYLDADVDAGETSDRGVYVNNLEQLGLSTVRMVGGALTDREGPADYLRDPWVLAPLALASAGLALGVWRRQWWLVGGVLLAVALPPAFSGKYHPILDGRYLMPLLPVLFVAMGLAIATAARLLATLPIGEGRPGVVALLGRSAAVVVLALGTAVLAAHPLSLLDSYYKESQEDGFSNVQYLRTVSQLEAARRGDEAVLLDPLLTTVKSTGGGKASTSFLFLLALSDIPNAPLPMAKPNETPGVTAHTDLVGRLAVLHRSTADNLDDTLGLEPLDGKRANGKDSPSYRAYRIGVFEAGAPPSRPRR